MAYNYDLGGVDLIVNTISTGASAPGAAGTKLTDIANAVTTDQTQTITGVKTFSANPALTVGNSIKSNVAATTLTSNAATVTSYFLQCTTPSLSTASGATQAEVITLTGLAAGDIAFVTAAGGTSTVQDYNVTAVCTTNTLTITIYNTGGSSLNGTLIFNVMVLKA